MMMMMMRAIGLVLLLSCQVFAQGIEREVFHLGGTGFDGDFIYNGECDTDCFGSICAGGSCNNVTPPCTCTLDANSYLLHTPADNSGVQSSVVRNFSSFLLTDGTVKVGSSASQGTALVLRVNNDFLMTGGKIDLDGKGGAGATGGACVSSTAGSAGGSNSVNAGGAAGASGNNAGANGKASPFTGSLSVFSPFFPMILTPGSGGGSGPVSGQTVAPSLTFWTPAVGGTGAGGGGCAASCSGTFSAGGRGGGMVRIEAAGGYTCTGGTITTQGKNGASGGGAGGGGGGIQVLAWRIDADTCTYSTNGGTGGGSPPTNCGDGGIGGSGGIVVEAIPR